MTESAHGWVRGLIGSGVTFGVTGIAAIVSAMVAAGSQGVPHAAVVTVGIGCIAIGVMLSLFALLVAWRARHSDDCLSVEARLTSGWAKASHVYWAGSDLTLAASLLEAGHPVERVRPVIENGLVHVRALGEDVQPAVLALHAILQEFATQPHLTGESSKALSDRVSHLVTEIGAAAQAFQDAARDTPTLRTVRRRRTA